MQEKYDFVLDLLNQAVEIFHENSRGKILEKEGDARNIVTDLDILLNNFLKGKILEKFSTEKIYSEEDGELPLAENSFWTIDPIDGTSNFASGIPHFAICLGFVESGVPVLGAAVNPLTGQVFSYLKDVGAYVNRKKIDKKAELEKFEMKRSTVNFNAGRTHENRDWLYKTHGKLLHEVKSIKYLGSSALDMCFVGAGIFQANIYPQLSTFDVAFSIGFVREAGGIVVDENFKDLELSYESKKVLAFGSEEIMQEFKMVLNEKKD